MNTAEICRAVGGHLMGEAEISSVCTDSRAITSGCLFVAIKGERFDGNRYVSEAFAAGAAAALATENLCDVAVPQGKSLITVPDTVEALGRLASYHRRKFSIPLVGITGSVGKTTTKEMIACVLATTYHTHKTSGNFNNEIGLPMTLLDMEPTCEAAVIEMGMSNFGEIARLTAIAKPTIGVITNIGMSHIGQLGSQENILKAKLEITQGMAPGSVLLVNGDDPLLHGVSRSDVTVRRYGFAPDCDVRGYMESDDRFTVDGVSVTVPVAGKHNLYNALAAVAVGQLCGIDAAVAAEGIATYQTDEIRQNAVTLRDGVTVIRDYYNASPPAVCAALQMLGKGAAKRRIAVLGDMLELGTFAEKCHRETGCAAYAAGVDILIAVGELSRYTAESAAASGVREVQTFADNAAAAAYLVKNMREGDHILIKGSHGMKMEEIYEIIR